jgi:hypothetical protein
VFRVPLCGLPVFFTVAPRAEPLHIEGPRVVVMVTVKPMDRCGLGATLAPIRLDDDPARYPVLQHPASANLRRIGLSPRTSNADISFAGPPFHCVTAVPLTRSHHVARATRFWTPSPVPRVLTGATGPAAARSNQKITPGVRVTSWAMRLLPPHFLNRHGALSVRRTCRAGARRPLRRWRHHDDAGVACPSRRVQAPRRNSRPAPAGGR